MNMWSRKKRILALGLFAAGVTFGVALEVAMDPFEGAGLAWVGLALGTLLFAGVVGHWYSRKLAKVGEVDERYQAIERHASRNSHGTLTIGLAALATILVSLPWIELPVPTLLWALLIGSIAVHELSVEYYRRQM